MPQRTVADILADSATLPDSLKPAADHLIFFLLDNGLWYDIEKVSQNIYREPAKMENTLKIKDRFGVREPVRAGTV